MTNNQQQFSCPKGCTTNNQPILDAAPLVDLRQYDQSKYNRGRPNWFVFLWWLVQAIAFPLSPHTFNSFRRWLLKLFGAKIGTGVIIRPTEIGRAHV